MAEKLMNLKVDLDTSVDEGDLVTAEWGSNGDLTLHQGGESVGLFLSEQLALLRLLSALRAKE